MKKIILTSIIILASILTYAGEKEYMEAMGKNLQELGKAKTSADFLSLANGFERIAEAEQDEWLPNYYVAYSYINMVFAEGSTEDIDKTLDKAEAFLEKARELSPDNSEIEVLQGWIYQGRIQVDPMGRGMSYSQKAAESFGKAKNLNPDNPRIYFLSGQNILYTPEMFGGGQEAACPYFLEAKEKYETFTPETAISPNWGKEYTIKLAASCK
jgi:tetratricopeptide (TPR) repeat protein